MKTAFLSISLFLLCCTGFAQTKIDYRKKGAPIPAFGIEALNGKIISNAVLKANKPVMLVIFSPDCPHCIHALDTLKGLTDQLKDIQLVLLTEEVHKAQLEDFLKKSELDKNPSFKYVGTDKSHLIYLIYAYGMLPQFTIYDSKHSLVKTFSGIFPLDSLKMYLPNYKASEPLKKQ